MVKALAAEGLGSIPGDFSSLPAGVRMFIGGRLCAALVQAAISNELNI